MTMEEYESRFMNLLNYVDFIHCEKVKIQHFLSGLPAFYKDKISYDEPYTLKETIRNAKLLYEKNKGRHDIYKS